MRSFLGVPIVERGCVIGALYLTDKADAEHFSEADQAVIETLAAHAAIAIANARLHERSRELSIVEERNRLARELHDAVAQKLFATVLAAESASTLIARDRDGAEAELERVQALAREAMGELRSLIFELRPASLEAEGLATTLRKHIDVLRRVSGQDVRLRADGAPRLDPDAESEVFRVAQEALHNAVRHADARRIDVRLTNGDGRLVLEVSDDGAGFDAADPGLRSRRLGLTSMEERAAALGGVLRIESNVGGGTRVRLEVPA
jgi:signal transduction histidine kinase